MKTDKNKELLIEQLKKTPIIENSCHRIGIGRSSYYRWRKDDSEFAKQADEALDEGVYLMNDYAESQLLSLIKNGNSAGIFYWLNHRHPAYGNKLEVTATAKHEEESLTNEQQKAVKKALELTSFVKEKGDKK